MGNCLGTRQESNVMRSNRPEDIPNFMEQLKQVQILSSLSSDELKLIASNLHERTFTPGEFLMKEGEEGSEFFMILKGTCVVWTHEIGEIAELHAGDYCGEQSLLNSCMRTASVQAKTSSSCLVLGREEFINLLGEQSKIKFAKRCAKRTAVLANANPIRPVSRKSVLKNNETKEWLMQAIQGNILFETMEDEQKLTVIKQMHREKITKGTNMIVEGEEGDEFYVIAEGEFQVLVNNSEVAILQKGHCCGELALMYDAPRNATIRAKTDGVVWVVQRSAFRAALRQLCQERDARHVEALRRYEIFNSLLTNELMLISDACTEHTYEAGTTIIKEGEEGDRFYMILEGEGQYKKSSGESGSITKNFFGELALLNDEKRAATVIARTKLKTLELKREDFTILLGPIEGIMKEKSKSYVRKETATKAAAEEVICELTNLKKLGVLGKGAFGFVTLVEDPVTEKVYALKAIRKVLIIEHNQECIILREKKIMQRLSHRRLVNCARTYRNEFCVFFLLDACLGGELFTILRKKRYFPEKTARFYSACVIEGFEYMHSKDIIYRDLKPENLVLDLDGYLKIADFGFAKLVKDKTFTLCGTPDYLAPEIVTGQGHGKGVDWWTLGVLIYEMLASVSPFYASDPLMMYRNIVRGKYKTPKYFSEEVADLVQKLLCRRATKRLGVINGGTEAIKNHPWYRGIDWTAMGQNRYRAPHIPKIQSKRDFSNFKQVKDDNGAYKAAKLKHEREFEK